MMDSSKLTKNCEAASFIAGLHASPIVPFYVKGLGSDLRIYQKYILPWLREHNIYSFLIKIIKNGITFGSV